MADVSQIKLPNGSVYDLIDEKSGYITAEYIENKTDYEIPVSRVGEIVVGETAIGTDSTNFPTSKAVVDYVDERVVQEMAAIDVGVISVNGKTGSVTLSASDVGAITQSELDGEINNVYNDIINESGFITASDVSTNETDPTVPAWAKASTKPTYTASEVGALPSDTIIPEDKVFIAIRGTTSLSDIFTAKDAGKVIFCKDGSQGVIWRFTGNSGSSTNGTATFERIDGLDGAESMHSLKYLQLSRYLGQESWAVFTRTIPYRTSDLTNDSGYLTASDIASVMTYKGTKANYAALPASGNTTGDVWHLTDTGAEWAWDGSAWQELGTAIDLSGYATKATTLAGYGITDAKIQNGTITLGSNTITPLTSFTETDPTVPSWAKASSKPSYSLTEISGTDDLRVIEGLTGTTGLLKKTAANTWTLDTNTYLTSYTETDPTVPSWAKQSSKPTYTATEVGALPSTTAIPSKTSDLTNDSGFITSYTDEKVKTTLLNSGDAAMFLVGGINFTTTQTLQVSSSLYYDLASTYGILVVGNSSAGIKGTLRLQGTTSNTRIHLTHDATANRSIYFPDASGTIALTSDIPTVYSSTNTGGYLTMATLPIYDGTVE